MGLIDNRVKAQLGKHARSSEQRLGRFENKLGKKLEAHTAAVDGTLPEKDSLERLRNTGPSSGKPENPLR